MIGLPIFSLFQSKFQKKYVNVCNSHILSKIRNICVSLFQKFYRKVRNGCAKTQLTLINTDWFFDKYAWTILLRALPHILIVYLGDHTSCYVQCVPFPKVQTSIQSGNLYFSLMGSDVNKISLAHVIYQ